LSITEEQDVLHAGRKLVELLDLRGWPSSTSSAPADGRLLLFEINARTSLWMHPGRAPG